MKSRIILFLSLIVVLAVGTAGYYGFSSSVQQLPIPETPQTVAVTTCDVQQTVTAPGDLHNTSETLILMPTDGTLSEVLVHAGESVRAGQVLARLDDTLRAQAEIDLRDAQKAYQTAYKYRLSLNGKQWLKRVVKYVYDNGQQIPIFKWYRGYVDAQTIKSADENLALKQAELDDAQAVLDQMELKAPFRGVVTAVADTTVVGVPKLAGDTLFTMIDPKALEMQANVTQEDYPLLKTGQTVQVYFDARPDVNAQGRVDRIVPKVLEGDSPTYDVFIKLDEVPDGLVDGMTADANVMIASRSGALCLPRSVVHASADNKATVEVWNGSSTESREITVGLRGDSNVEILSGLEEGEQVVVK